MNIKYFASSLFAMVLLFGLGVYLGGRISEDRIYTEIYGKAEQTGSIEINSALLNEAISEIENNYLGEIPDRNEITYGVLKGIVGSLGDDFSAYLNPEETIQYKENIDSAYEGIGVYLGFDGQNTTVLTPIDGFPGQKAGLLAGDVILKVNDEDVMGLRPELTAKKILGPAGTEVKIVIFRYSDKKEHEFQIVRDRIDLESIEYKELDNNIVLIDILRFTEGDEGNVSGVQVFNRNWDRIAREVVRKNPKGLIIDLRNNPGGYVHSVRYVLEDFLSDGEVIMREEDKFQGKQEFLDDRKGEFEDIPIVVLVNGGSASASEIFAGSIQDHGRGEVIGTSTYGKGVEQVLVELEDNSLLMLVYKRWLTPDGRHLDKENPIEPDETIIYEPASEGKDRVYDNQVMRAMEILMGDNKALSTK